jgi:predicted nucleotidyltransferase
MNKNIVYTMLSTLFKTKERQEILDYVLKRDQISVTQVSNDTGISKGLVSRYLANLKQMDIVKRNGQKYQVNDKALTRAIKILINLKYLRWETITKKWILSAGLYGSWADGTNTEESDIDIWIKVDKYPSEYQLNSLYKDLRNKTFSELNLFILTPEKLKNIKQYDLPFYNSLLNSLLILEGDALE